MDEVDIRAPREGEMAALSVVAAAAYAYAYAGLWTAPERLAVRLQRFTADALADWAREPGVRLLVPFIGGEPVGFMGLRLRSADPLGADPAACELQRIYLLPNAQSRGLGRRLLARAEAVARADGASALWLKSMAEGPACAAYVRWGFRPVGEARLDNDTPHLSAMVVMRKEIAA